MIMFSSKNFKRMGDLVYKSYYQHLFKGAVSLLRQTRIPILRKSNLWLGGIQQNMVKYRKGFEEVVAKGRVASAKDEEEKKAIDVALRANKEFIRVLKDIGDGIAWRNLNYQRPLIRLMSENAPTGNIGPDADTLVRLLGARTRWSDRVIINDLTHCLRIADLTIVTRKDRIMLYEVKARKNKTELINVTEISRRIRRYKQASKQSVRHWIVQYAIIDKKVKTPDKEVRIVDLSFPVRTHVSKIKKLIKDAGRENFSAALLEDGYYIELCALDKIFQKNDRIQFKKQLDSLKPFSPHKNGWSDMSLCISNYDTFYESINDRFLNFTPYSVLPFSAKDCVRLMMGQLYLRVCFDFKKLKERFEDAGWTVEIRDWKSLEEKNKEVIKKINERKGGFLEHSIDETIFKISKTDDEGTYTQDFPINLVTIMLSSFYATDYLLNMAGAAYLDAKSNNRGGGLSTFNCMRERDILR